MAPKQPFLQKSTAPFKVHNIRLRYIKEITWSTILQEILTRPCLLASPSSIAEASSPPASSGCQGETDTPLVPSSHDPTLVSSQLGSPASGGSTSAAEKEGSEGEFKHPGGRGAARKRRRSCESYQTGLTRDIR
jgi:hypothetical protein